jgi:hypothetical protein
MQIKIIFICSLLSLQLFCNNNAKQQPITTTTPIKVNTKVSTIPLLDGYTRVQYNDTSFATYLRNVALLQSNTVYLFNGQPKTNQTAHYAILNISVGKKDLQQCADAVMRLRAEYLFAQKKYNDIVFIDNEKVKYSFTAPYTHEHLLQYLDKVFGMCGTASLSIQMKSKANLNDIQPGDVFIKGGFPGHACIVMDVAQNEKKEKIFMLSQSYMPAQQIHILKNYANSDENPWYAVSEIEQYLKTPEYIFTNQQLKSW